MTEVPHRLVRSNLTSDHCERCLLDWPCPAVREQDEDGPADER